MLADFFCPLGWGKLRRLAVASVIPLPTMGLLCEIVEHPSLRCWDLLAVVRLDIALSMGSLSRRTFALPHSHVRNGVIAHGLTRFRGS